MIQDLPERVKANKDNDLLFRSTPKSEEELKKERERQQKLGCAMGESGDNAEGPLEYFTE